MTVTTSARRESPSDTYNNPTLLVSLLLVLRYLTTLHHVLERFRFVCFSARTHYDDGLGQRHPIEKPLQFDISFHQPDRTTMADWSKDILNEVANTLDSLTRLFGHCCRCSCLNQTPTRHKNALEDPYRSPS